MLEDKFMEIFFIILFIICGIILFLTMINPNKTVAENAKHVYNVSLDKMNTTYGTAKRDAEKSAQDAKDTWDQKMKSIYKMIILYILVGLCILFNIFNRTNSITVFYSTNGIFIASILFEYFSDLLDNYLKDKFNSIENDLKIPPNAISNIEETPRHKILILFITLGICITSISSSIWYYDKKLILYSLVSYLLSVLTMAGVSGFDSEKYLFLLFFLVNIPIVTFISNKLNLYDPTKESSIYIPLLIAFYILSTIILTIMGIIDISNNSNLWMMLSIIGIAFLFFSMTLKNSIYKTFYILIAMITLFIALMHYIINEQNWMIYVAFYIILILFVLYITKEKAKNVITTIQAPTVTKREIMLLSVEIAVIFVFLYIRSVIKKRYTKHGQLIINKPVRLDDYSRVKINNNSSYNYGLSVWVFIEPMNPGSKPQATDYTTVLTCDSKPLITYNSALNTMRIEIKTDSRQNKIVDEIKSFPLQKWNHIVMNYVNGTCDVFLNGELHVSKIEIIPIKEAKEVEIGTVDGIQGSVCNLIFFDKHLSSLKIKELYKEFSDKTPPII